VYHADKVEDLYKEAQALQKLSHPNIVKLFNAFLIKNNVVLIMELISGGELYKYVKDKDGLTESEAREFFIQLADAVEYCHSRYIIHRDLKPSNILLSDTTSKKITVLLYNYILDY
jgi:serine/threonine protein kinase